MTGSSKKDTDLFIISGEQLEKLKWNCGSASPAIHDLEPIIRSRPYNLEKEKAAAINGVLEDIWKFCLINGAEEHGDLIAAPSDGFFTLKLLKKIAEMRYGARHRQQEEEGGGER